MLRPLACDRRDSLAAAVHVWKPSYGRMVVEEAGLGSLPQELAKMEESSSAIRIGVAAHDYESGEQLHYRGEE